MYEDTCYIMSCYEDSMHRDSDSIRERGLHLVRSHNRNWERELYRDIVRELAKDKERNRNMKITVPDASHVNWEKVGETIREQITAKVLEVLNLMQEALKDLEPGQRKTIQIKVGSVTVSKPK